MSEDSLLHSLNVNNNGIILDKGTTQVVIPMIKKADSGIEFLRQPDPRSDLIKKFSFIFPPLEFSSIKVSKHKQKTQNESESLEKATGGQEISFCHSQVQRGTFNKPVTAVTKHVSQRVRSTENVIRPIPLRIRSEWRQTTVQIQPTWEQWCPELHRCQVFPQPFHFFH